MFESVKSLDVLESELASLAAHLHAGTARFLCLLDEFDRREGWVGFKSCAHWLSWRCGFSARAAREQVRVARAVRSLPLIRSAFVRGELSYSKVRALTRIAVDATEETLLMWGRYGTAEQIEKIARGVRQARAAASSEARQKKRTLQYSYDDEGYLVIRARLDPEEGAVVLRALESAIEQIEVEDGPAGPREEDIPPGTFVDLESTSPIEQRRADALCLISESFMSTGARSAFERALVVVHTDEPTLQGRAELAHGPPLSPHAVRRIACDAGLLRVTDAGATTIGRRTRVVPIAMRRMLRARDRGCRFPGCASQKTDAHHIQHWARGGHTALSNLVLLCRRHHRLVHEGGYSLESRARGEFIFRRPDGRALDAAPRAVQPGGIIKQNAALSIGSNTCAPLDGRAPDYNIAVESIIQMESNG